MEPATGTTTPDGTPPDGLLAKLWTGVVNFLTIKVPVWALMIAGLIGAVLIAAVAAGVKDVDQRQREADARQVAATAYTAQLRTYDLEVRARADCLASVERGDLNRGQHLALVSAIESLFPGSEAAAELVANLRAGPLLSSPPRDPDECPAEPVAPTPPAELIGAP